MNLEQKLVLVCRQHLLAEPSSATVREPYIPFIPNPWNGILVLAESQNHAALRGEYLRWLKGRCSDRIRRLYLYRTNSIGVQPWDDGSLKLAVEASLGEEAKSTAASNAVLWSQVLNGRNKNPDDTLMDSSLAVWKEMIAQMGAQLKIVVSAGKKADTIVKKCGFHPHIRWRLPAPTAISRISSMFSRKDLLARFPEVRAVLERHEDWGKKYPANKVFFACHAVSVTKEVLSNKRFRCAVKRRGRSAGANPVRQSSLQPVAIGAVVEVTKRLKPSMKRVIK